MTGRVVRLGAHVSTDAAGAPLHEGDRVVYSYFYPCRRCDFCRAGDAHHCVARRIGAGRAAKRREAPLHRCLRRLQLPPARHYVLRTPDALDDFLDRIAERLQLARAFGADHAP